MYSDNLYIEYVVRIQKSNFFIKFLFINYCNVFISGYNGGYGFLPGQLFTVPAEKYITKGYRI